MSTDQVPRVFVSYAHDSVQHKELVRQFATFLRTRVGLDVHLDRWYDDGRRDWSVWAIEQLREADFILVIASPAYRRRADGEAPPDEGRGAQFEAAIIRDNITRNLPSATRRVLPVVLPGRSVNEIPTFLCAHSTTHYVVKDFTLDAIGELLVAFTGVPRFQLPARGTFAVSSPNAVLSRGVELVVGDDCYLVHHDFLEEHFSADSSLVRRQARGEQPTPAGPKYVWLQQVEMRADTSSARAALTALAREHDMVVKLRIPGLPTAVTFTRDAGIATLVTTWPSSPDGPCETLEHGTPRLTSLAGVCATLANLHKRGFAHRNLTRAGLILRAPNQLVLRDLGLAAYPFRPGEGPLDYRAPEQRRARGQVGPGTDVYQLAAIGYHLLTGHPPYAAMPLPLQWQVRDLPRELCQLIDRALSADPAGRPDITQLGAALPAF
jgi:hypothetical protein